MKIYKDIEMMNPFCRVLVVIMKSKKYGVESVKMWVPLADSMSLRGRRLLFMMSGCSWVTTSGTFKLSAGDRDRGERMKVKSGGEPAGRPPDGSLMLGGLQQASVVGHDLVFRQVQVELQCDQDRELEGDQLSAIDSEPFLQFLPRTVMMRNKQWLILILY